MKRLANFLIYNNMVPIAIGILFLGAGATFAATPQGQQALVGKESKVVSIDNSFLLNTTITDATVKVEVNSVTEDDVSYYVDYSLSTLDVVDGAWKAVVKPKIMSVRKDSIIGQDLGLYTSRELGEVHDAEVRLLKETQSNQRQAGLTSKVVATEYKGLVGKFLDVRKDTFPDYDPLIDPAVGIPLTPEQQAAHREARKLLDAAREQQVQQAVQASVNGETPPNDTNSNGTGTQSTDTDATTGGGTQGSTASSSDGTSTPAPASSTSDPAPAPSVDSLFSPDTTGQ